MASEVLDSLTEEEAKTVAEKRKTEADLPSYYSAASNMDVKISREFEAFLILSTDEVKREAVRWLDNVSKLSEKNSDRDELIGLAINNDAADADAQSDAINNELGDFNAFREKFTTSSKFNSVVEVGMIISDMQLHVGELSMSQDRASHLVVLSKILQARLENNGINPIRTKQLDSWNVPLSSY